MYLTQLNLANFRNYVRLSLDMPPHITVLQGANAQGKTNFLESLYYLAAARSPYATGDIQLINNYAVLHSRSDFVDHPEPERKRNMLRMWINSRIGRPLAPAFADRFNTGARGGVAVGQGGGYHI